MKRFHFLIFCSVSANRAFSAPTIKAITNAYWNSAATWDLNHQPAVGETGIYHAERNTDAGKWNTVASVATSNSSVATNCPFTYKNNAPQTSYYRINLVDVDGEMVYTSVKSIKAYETTSAPDIIIASMNKNLRSQFTRELKETFTLRFVSHSGQMSDQQTISNPVDQIVLNSKLTGNHIISLSNGQDINT